MGIGMVIWIVVVGLLVWLVVRAMSQRSGSGESAEDLLRRRFAAGEIDDEEFTKRLEVLRRNSTRPDPERGVLRFAHNAPRSGFKNPRHRRSLLLTAFGETGSLRPHEKEFFFVPIHLYR